MESTLMDVAALGAHRSQEYQWGCEVAQRQYLQGVGAPPRFYNPFHRGTDEWRGFEEAGRFILTREG